MQKIRQDRNMGKNIKMLRNRCEMTQEQVASKLHLMGCDISRSYYSRYETGELNIPITVIIALKQIFDCNYDDFFLDLD